MDVGFQLFSARKHPLEYVLKKVASLGYTHVEGYGSLYEDAPAFKRLLDSNGLTMPTAHVDLTVLEDTEKALRLAGTLGIKVVICPWLAPELRPLTLDGWKALSDRFQKIAQRYEAAGLTFGYHNHDFEFATYEGRYAIDLMLEHAPSLNIEADIGWVVRAKVDPATWLTSHGDRIVAIHVKDVAAPGENSDEGGWADAGYGVVGWKTLLPIIRKQTKARYFVAEHDNPSDLERFATRAIAFIKSIEA